RGSEREDLLEIGGALTASVRMDEIRDGGLCPRRLDQCVGLREEGGGDPIQGGTLATTDRQKSPQRGGFERRPPHALTLDRIESAERVAQGNEPSRKRVEPIVVTMRARRKAVPHDVADARGVLDGAVDGRRPEALRIVHESGLVAG